MSGLSEHISFFIPAYNCESTIRDTVESIMVSNFSEGDELIIVNDASIDNTEDILHQLRRQYPEIQIVHHTRNKGGAAARNTAIEHAKHELVFCLDSDNLLAHDSAHKLKGYLVQSEADVAAFQYVHYFKKTPEDITHKWKFTSGRVTLADCLAGLVTPGASGNYLFTKQSWERASGYPEFSGALDAWGFGFRQLATDSKMVVMPDSFYLHRFGHQSYWVREEKKKKTSLTALQIVLPYIELFRERDVNYIMSRKGRYTWFETLDKHPIRLKDAVSGRTGRRIGTPKKPFVKRTNKMIKQTRKRLAKYPKLFALLQKIRTFV